MNDETYTHLSMVNNYCLSTHQKGTWWEGKYEFMWVTMGKYIYLSDINVRI